MPSSPVWSASSPENSGFTGVWRLLRPELIPEKRRIALLGAIVLISTAISYLSPWLQRKCINALEIRVWEPAVLFAAAVFSAIAAARLLLQEDPGAVGTEVEVELLKIEQYVDMVLGYLRLDSESTDYVLRDTDLDGLLRQAVRKFARMFILKKITLDFRETGRTVLTDGKWLSFVVEQVLSNALKYTPAGGRIRIYGDGETLVIADSGIGIRPEDLPRVFEKGFTGYNGREDKKSTGIGLYLCRRVMDRLNHGISIVSRPGQGTLVRLDLSRGRRVVE